MKTIIMKPFCLLLVLAAATSAFHLDISDRQVNPTSVSEVLTTDASSIEAKSRFAMLDDVRLLANGLLQLGQSLREFVHKTKAQINDIFQKLNIFDRSFNQLSVVTSEIKEEEEELKKTTNILKANNEEIRNLSLEINSKINNILQERTQLQNKVGSLEERLKGLSETVLPADQLSEITTLKEVIGAQEKTISNLLKAVTEQHDQLDHQKLKIKILEDKVNYDAFQDTIDKTMDSDHSAADMFDYLPRNSTGWTNDLPVDCSELYINGEVNSGIYAIKPNHSEPFYAYCEMSSGTLVVCPKVEVVAAGCFSSGIIEWRTSHTNGAPLLNTQARNVWRTYCTGSTVIQRRTDGSVDFDKTWEMYEKGFGVMEKDFWLGLQKIQSFTQQQAYILRIDVEDWKEEKHWAEYNFSVEGPSKDYALHVSHFSGDLPDAMSNITGAKFSTKDKNNDSCNLDCARSCSGGWWLSACSETSFNGKYFWLRAKGRSLRRKGIQWKPGTGSLYSFKMTKISLRRVPDSGI